MSIQIPPETKYIHHDDGTYEMDCAHSVHVYHFSWDELVCGWCRQTNKNNPNATEADCEISKSDWLLQAPDWSITPLSTNSLMIE